jgi:hypothetical protein
MEQLTPAFRSPAMPLIDGIPLTASVVAETAIFHGRAGYGFFAVARSMAAPTPSTATLPGIPIKTERLWRERYYHVRQTDQVLPTMLDSVDTYITQATFRQFKDGRKVRNLARVGALWSDLDTYKVPELRNLSTEQLVPLLLQECVDRGLPRPSVIIDSGNGLYCKWVLSKPVPEAALRRWRRVQDEICQRLQRFHADPNACDAARVLRAIGSVNGRTGRRVRIVWQNEFPFDDHGGHREPGVPIMLYAFDVLADEVLQQTREQIREARARRQAARAAAKAVGERRNTAGLRAFDARQLANDRYADVQRLLQLRGWEAGAPPGERDMPMFVSVACLALTHPVGQLRQLVPQLAARIAPTWTEQQIQSCLHSVLDRAERSARGEANVWNGYEIDPRYTPSNRWLIEALRITPEEERELKTIISADEARRRDAERAMVKRRAAGAQPRNEFLSTAQARRDQAQALREQGMSWADVGAQLGISAGAARALGTRARPKRTGPSVSL